MKQTVEEAAMNFANYESNNLDKLPFKVKNVVDYDNGLTRGFKAGADWQAKQSPWISVEERLPENNTVVLTRGAYGFLICQLSSLGEWETGANVNKERLGITHWMPIPFSMRYSKPTRMYWNGLRRKETEYGYRRSKNQESESRNGDSSYFGKA